MYKLILAATIAIADAQGAMAAPVVTFSRPVIVPPVRTYTPPPVRAVPVYTPPARTHAPSYKKAEAQRSTAIRQGAIMPVIVNGQYCTPKDREPGGRCNK